MFYIHICFFESSTTIWTSTHIASEPHGPFVIEFQNSIQNSVVTKSFQKSAWNNPYFLLNTSPDVDCIS